MAKFIKTNPSGKIEICIRKSSHEKTQDYRYCPQSRFIREYNQSSWIKVVFSDGSNFDQEWIRQELQKAATGPNNHRECVLQIFNFRVTAESAILFIKSNNISYSSFKSNCGKIPHPHNGQPCDVVVMSIQNPETPSILPEKWINSLKEALSIRYNDTTKSLNLSNFTDDSYLNSQGLWISLNRPAVIRAIVNLLQSVDNFSLVDLDISNNNFTYTVHLAPLFEVVPIQNLNLSDNALIYKSLMRTLQYATFLQSLTIRNDNGMCGQKIKYLSSFLPELVENCPTLKKFNNEDLNNDDLFGVATRLPATRKGTSENDQRLLNFFNEHAQKIESNRDELVDYYSSDSVLTLSACYHDMSMNNRRLSEVYLRNSRNLDRLKDEGRRSHLVKRGAAQILGLLAEIPKLRHITESFSVDAIVNDEQSKMFVVNGLFVECLKIPNRKSIDEMNSNGYGGVGSGAAAATATASATGVGTTHNVFNVRMFSRAMIVVAPGKIVQENWTITNPTDFLFRKYREKFEDIKNIFDSEKAAARNDDAKTNSAIIVDNFCQFSNMNREFSLQCLQESNWDVDKAKEIFQRAFNNNNIPAAAFQK